MNFGSSLKLLVVDDEERLLKRIKEFYTKKGLVVFTATDGQTAIRLFEQEKPQICLIDIEDYSSQINGLGILTKIKEIDKGTFCFMFAYPDQEAEMQQARALGAVDCFIKPFYLHYFDKYVEMIKSIFAIK
jgi:DNA-binding response OmpR family regulator